MQNQKAVIVVVAGLLIGAAITFYWNGEIPVSGSDNAGLVYDIDTEEDWVRESGVVWSSASSTVEDGRFRIVEFGEQRVMGHASGVAYRTRMVNATDDPIRLKQVEARGNIGDTPHASMLMLRVLDCDVPPLRGSLPDCWTDDQIVHSSGMITETGEVVYTGNLSSVVADGYVIVEMAVAANTTSPHVEDPQTYWDSLRLTAHEQEQ